MSRIRVDLSHDPADKRLMELALYVADRCADDKFFGSIKLNKVLFWADMLYYAQHGETITGAEYQRLQFGPAPRRMLPVLNELDRTKRGIMRQRETQRGTQKRLVALSDPELNLFTADQIAHVERIMQGLDGHCADELSEMTHRDATWKFARDGETINPNAIFISDEPIDAAEMEPGLREAVSQGLV